MSKVYFIMHSYRFQDETVKKYFSGFDVSVGTVPDFVEDIGKAVFFTSKTKAEEYLERIQELSTYACRIVSPKKYEE